MSKITNWTQGIFNYNDFNRDRFIANIAKNAAPDSRVLDAGAGPCRYRKLFSHCDYSAQDFAKYEGGDHSYGDLNYICDITNIPEKSETFDLILCAEVFEHLPRPDEAVRELARLLKSGGRLVVTAPQGSGVHMPPYHFYGGFSPFWYRHFFAINGLSVESIESNGGFFKLYGQESRRFLGMVKLNNTVAKFAFFPVKLLLSVWFRLLLPLACNYLDRLDVKRDFTAGYFVQAIKSK